MLNAIYEMHKTTLMKAQMEMRRKKYTCSPVGREEDHGTRCAWCDRRSLISLCPECRKHLEEQ